MISRPAPTECFVYITLPGTTEPVTAARFELTADRNGNPIGRLVYGKSYLERADAVPIDPVELKLATRVYETTAMKGVFGALRDAGPDYWGRLVIERHVGKAPLGELDYDLTPMPHISAERRDLALICGDEGRFANKRNLLSQSRRFMLSAEEATNIITMMKERVSGTWFDTARKAGVSEDDCERISGAFAYPGFELDHVAPVGGV